MKLALFRRPSTEGTIVSECHFEGVPGWVRVSEYVEVEFPPRSIEDVGVAMRREKAISLEYHQRELARLMDDGT